MSTSDIDIRGHARSVLSEAIRAIYSPLEGSQETADALLVSLERSGLVIAAKPADHSGEGQAGNYVAVPVSEFLFEGDELKRGQYEMRLVEAVELHLEWMTTVLSTAGFFVQAEQKEQQG